MAQTDPTTGRLYLDNTIRVVVWFSCGAASAVAAYYALKEYPRSQVQIVYCDTSKSESSDNGRFMRDVEQWLGIEVIRIRSSRYASIDDVFEERKYLAGIHGAPCTVEMKKVPRFEYQRADDVHIFGLTADEESRIRRFSETNHELNLRWILLERGITKARCLKKIAKAGIEIPLLYRQGYKNNNCIGCVKATSIAYWKKIRDDYPDVFEKRIAQSRKFDVRLTRLKGQRIFLDEIPRDIEPEEEMENISCGPECAGESNAD